ncbi:MAG: SRPBCC family protein [Sphaerobacter sp.]|nr:SRPBCC family protein [Sphaerobacter sp.]
MATVTKTIDVKVPLRTAYNQWTQFEEFPRFMEGVKEVRQLDDRHLHWRAEVGGQEQQWEAEIIEQVPDRLIAWESLTGDANAGEVTFDPIDAETTRITLELEYEPHGMAERVGDTLGLMDRRVQGDLERFKAFIESRGYETGGWRGMIDE